MRFSNLSQLISTPGTLPSKTWVPFFWMPIRTAIGPYWFPVDTVPGCSSYLRDRLFNDEKRFRLPNTPNPRDSGGSVSACDFDRDGDLDLFVGGRVTRGKYPETPGSALLLNEGEFVDRTDTLAQGLKSTGMVPLPCGVISIRTGGLISF